MVMNYCNYLSFEPTCSYTLAEITDTYISICAALCPPSAKYKENGSFLSNRKCIYIYIYISIFLSICLSIFLSIHLFIHLSNSQFIDRSIDPSICQSVFLFVFVYLFIFQRCFPYCRPPTWSNQRTTVLTNSGRCCIRISG